MSDQGWEDFLQSGEVERDGARWEVRRRGRDLTVARRREGLPAIVWRFRLVAGQPVLKEMTRCRMEARWLERARREAMIAAGVAK